MARQDDLKKLTHNHQRRLQILREQQALEGRSVDPKIMLEIEDIMAEIKDLQTELAVIERRVNPSAQTGVMMSGCNDEKTQSTTIPHILVVDDEPDYLDNLSLILDMAGYKTITAKDGTEALVVLQFKQVNLILSDISMPSMSGYQLYQRVCQHPRWVTIPFIFLSARDLDSDVYYGKELGADDYLTKPIRAENLLSVIHGKLRRCEAMHNFNVLS